MGSDNVARPPDPPDRTIALALAAGNMDLYVNSPSFHHAVDTLAALLPAMVDGLAAQAAERDEAAAALREGLERRAAGPRIIPFDEQRAGRRT